MRKKVTNELTLEGFEQADLVCVLREYLDTHTYHDGNNEKFLTVKRVYDFIIDNNGATELTISHNTDYSIGGK